MGFKVRRARITPIAVEETPECLYLQLDREQVEALHSIRNTWITNSKLQELVRLAGEWLRAR